MNNTDIVNIIPNLYISNWYTAENFDILEKYNIKAIITLETRPKSSYVLDYYNRHNIDFKYIFIEDSVDADISKYFDVTYDFIKSHISKGDNVLVHCYAGISRSSSIILNYMIRFIYESGKSVIDNPRSVVFNALSYSRSKRPFINPNPGFIEQLIEKSVEYSKNINKKDLNYSNNKVNMSSSSCDVFTDVSGKPGNVVCLTNDDFDVHGNLKNFSNMNGVIFFGADWCGFCKKFKPEFASFSLMLNSNEPIRAFYVNADKNNDLISRISSDLWGYDVNGFPCIVGYSQGKFFSEYGMDPSNRSVFRTAKDVLEYARELGKSDVVINYK